MTGGIGAGKSEVLKILGEMGFPVLQADKIGHALLKDRVFSKKLASRFGLGVLDSRGLVDRKKLGAVVFKNPGKKARTEPTSYIQSFVKELSVGWRFPENPRKSLIWWRWKSPSCLREKAILIWTAW